MNKQMGPVVTGENVLPPLSEFKVTSHQALLAFGSMPDTARLGPHQFTTIATYGSYQIEIDPAARYGRYKHALYDQGGSLYFCPNDEGSLELVDFDGMMCLPRDVRLGLVKAGFVVENNDL
jgi:hypothetical protein